MKKLAMKSLLLLSVFAGAVVVLPQGAQAQAPGPHPAYGYALQDLRLARAYLNDGWAWEAVRQEDNHAIAEIDAAIHDIKAAAWDDGKNINDHPPIDMHLAWHDRFGHAEDRLKAAHNDIAQAEDVHVSRDLRDRALRHIDAAEAIVDQAWRTAHWQ
jgi:hypothetical protein